MEGTFIDNMLKKNVLTQLIMAKQISYICFDILWRRHGKITIQKVQAILVLWWITK